MKLVYLKYDLKYFLRNLRYRLKYRLCRAQQRNVLYFVFEPGFPHSGVADRLKAVISLYNTAKSQGYDFRFYFETPFHLADYLAPRHNWTMSLDDLEYSLKDTKIINETSWHPAPALLPNKQYHCYCYAGNDIPWQFKDTGYLWHELFQELFQPSPTLQQAYDELHLTPHSYVSVHFRFVNALEQFENTFFNNHLETEEERQNLIKKCHNCLTEIQHENPTKEVYVFSDSKVFLQSLNQLPVKALNSDNIGHTGDATQHAIHLKTFLDLFVMSQSERIYRVRGKELYNLSCFALLASRIGNVEFIDKNI